VIWYRKLSYQMTLTVRLMSTAVDDVTRDVTGRQGNLHGLMTFYGLTVGAMLVVMLPVMVTSALGTIDRRQQQQVRARRRHDDVTMNDVTQRWVRPTAWWCTRAQCSCAATRPSWKNARRKDCFTRCCPSRLPIE